MLEFYFVKNILEISWAFEVLKGSVQGDLSRPKIGSNG
jgi:hypothetical protein